MITLAASFVPFGALDDQLFNERLPIRIELATEPRTAIEIKLYGNTPEGDVRCTTHLTHKSSTLVCMVIICYYTV